MPVRTPAPRVARATVSGPRRNPQHEAAAEQRWLYSPEGVHRLQASVGNRAVGALLARKPYPREYVKSESVVQPPVSWTKYPPAVERMSRVQLYDAMQLIDDWKAAHPGSTYAKELSVLHKQLEGRAKEITPASHRSRYRRWVKLDPADLERAYQQQSENIVEDRQRGSYSYSHIEALDEVVQDRQPGAAWHAAAKKRLLDAVAEADRRRTRLAQLPLDQQQKFEQLEVKTDKFSHESRVLARELMWLWLNLRDAGRDRKEIEQKVLAEIESLYEQLLRQIDAVIQAECKKNQPRTTGERIRANIAKAYGDPCKPWFEGRWSKGEDELRHFRRILRIRRADDPYDSVYYWVEAYRAAYLLLTDSQTQLNELRRQAMLGILTGGLGVIANYSRFIRQAAIPFLGRRLGSGLRSSMLGFRLAMGDPLGGAGDVGSHAAQRPKVVAVGPPKPTAPAPAKQPPAKTPARPAPATSTQPAAERPPVRDPYHQLSKPRDHASVAAVKQGLRTDLEKTTRGNSRADLNPTMKALLDEIDQGRIENSPQNKKLVARLPAALKAIRDAAGIEDTGADLWSTAGRRGPNGTTVREALEEGVGPIQDIRKSLDQDDPRFREVLRGKGPFRDLAFAADTHGAHTHMFQERVLDRALGPGAGREFRHLIAEATGDVKIGGKTRPLWGAAWDAMFDDLDGGGHINHPETLGRILQDHVGLPRWQPKKP